MLLPRLTYEPGFLFVVEVWREAVAESAQVSGNNRQASIVKALRKIKIIIIIIIVIIITNNHLIIIIILFIIINHHDLSIIFQIFIMYIYIIPGKK